jgi:predicted ferric reductase
VLAYPLLRKPSYEIFLRTHQALAALFAYSMWRHLPSDQTFPRGYVYISVGLFLVMFVLQSGSVIFQNGIFRYHLPRATITHDHGAVKVRMHLQKPLKIDDGQYINLWMPFVSFWSFAQGHPFMVISWALGKQDTVDLLIEPRRGVTQELLVHAKKGSTIYRLVMFSGPHGTSVAMDEYETILMIASGFGIAAHLAHLKRLIHGYSARLIRARRIHLVWQIRDKGKSRFHKSQFD